MGFAGFAAFVGLAFDLTFTRGGGLHHPLVRHGLAGHFFEYAGGIRRHGVR